MRKKWRRWSALLLITAMVLTLLPFSALADEAMEQEKIILEDNLVLEEGVLPAVPEREEESLSRPESQAALSEGLTVTVPEDDITLIAAKVNWTAVSGVSSYTVSITSTEHSGLGSDNIWYQDNTARTVKLVNLHPGKTYTVTVTGGSASGSATFTTKQATNAKAEASKLDPEAPAPYGALPDDQQLYYHENDMAAFIHFGPNTFNNVEWGTGNESVSDFDPTDLNQDVIDGWIKQLQDAGFKRLIMVAKHHDGYCLWDTQYTDQNVMNSPYGQDLLEQVSIACTKYDMDMGFYFSPWDMHDSSYGQGDAYNEYYMNQLREVLGNTKYGNNGVFVETWMDGAKGSNVTQEYDFDGYFKLIKELQPECLIYTDRADGGVRWSGNEVGSTGSNPAGTGAGDMCWQTMNVGTFNYEGTNTPGMMDPWKPGGSITKWHRQRGAENGVIWSVCECDVSIESGWFGKNGNSLRELDALIDMYLTSAGYGSPFLLNVPPVRTGHFRASSAARLAELGKAIRDTFRTDMLRENGYTVTATADKTRTSQTAGKFGAANLIDGDPDTYWTMDDGQTSGSVTINLGATRTFDVVTLKEYIPLGQRIKAGKVEYHDDTGWHDFSTFTTIGAKRIIRVAPVKGDQIRVTISGSNAVPLLSAVEVYKARSGMELGSGIPDGLEYIDDRDSAVSYSGSWTGYDNSDGFSNTHKGSSSTSSSVTVTFTGSKFYVMGIKDPGHGPVKITIDGQDEYTFDTHAESRATKQVLFVSPDLSNGQHTITLRPLQGSPKTFLDFDGIFYLPGSKSILEFEYDKYTTVPNGVVNLKVMRSGDGSGEVSFKINDLPGTAVQGQHYVPLAEVVTMVAGETEKVIPLNVLAGTTGNSSAGKDFGAGISEPSANAIIGFQSEASIDILNPDDTAQTPVEDTYTSANAFLLPSEKGKTNRLEAEHMVLDASGVVVETKYIRLEENSSASGGKVVGWFEEGNKTQLHYYAPKAGTYTMTFCYMSGRDSSNPNTLNWRGGNVEPRSTNIPGTNGYETAEFNIVVTKSGYGVLEFYADSHASPNIDYIDFTLTQVDNTVESITLDKNAVTLYLNGAEGEDMSQLVATVLPEGAENGVPVWKSSNPDVAYVRQDGTVGARSNGTTVISATAGEDGDLKTAAATITVKTKVTGEVTISGEPKYNSILVASVNQISHQGAKDGLAYQWNVDGTPVSGATRNTYTVRAGDIGHEITVTATATGYYEGTKTAAPVTGARADGPAVVATLDYVDCTPAGNDGKIIGLNPARAYEYKLVSAGEDAWQQIAGTPGVTELGGLAPGSYHVRVKETATHTAGPVSRTLTILAADETGNDINIGTFANGVVQANLRRADAGTKITLTIIPSVGYQLKAGSLCVEGISGRVEVAADNTFLMPDEAVTVTAQFERKTYIIEHRLENITCTMGQQNHIVNHGDKPAITLAPVEGFELPETIVVRRKSGSVFSDYTYRNAVITFMQGIDADIEIIGEGVAKTYTVTYQISHLSATQAPRSVSHGDTLTFAIQPVEEYTLPETIQVTVAGKELPASAYTYSADGTVVIDAVKITGNVTIIATGVRQTAALEGVSISGLAKMGQQLTSTITPAEATAVYQWIRVENGIETEIPGATYPRYVLSTNDVGKTVKLQVTGTGGYGGTVTSQPTELVADAPVEPVTGVTLDQTRVSLGVGKTLQLTAVVVPENATNKQVRWMSSNEFVAKVNDRGVVTGLSEGEAIITVITNNGGLTAQCVVRVGAVTLDQATASITVGGKVTLTPTILAELTDKRVVWTSENTGIAVVDEHGVVTGVAAGTAVITVMTVEGNHVASCVVKVTTSGGNSSGGSGNSGGGGSSTTVIVAPPENNTTYPDGSTHTVEIDGRTGMITETTTRPDGEKAVKVITEEGMSIVVTDPAGAILAELKIPAVIAETNTGFVDVPQNHWAKESIDKIAALGLVKGVGSNLYDMGSPMARGSLATILYRLSNGKAGHETSFRDVKCGMYYTEGVAWAAKVGVVTGFTEEVFAPEQIITREQLAVMMTRYAKLVGMNTAADPRTLDAFIDGDETGDWAVAGVAWCVNNGILKGKGGNILDPTANVTRGEVAVMLDRFITLLK